MGQIFFRRGVNVHVFAYQSLIQPPFYAVFLPNFVPFFIFAGHNEIFQFRLLKFTHSKDKIARRDFVAERFSDLGNSKRQLARRRVDNVLKLSKNRLCRFRTQISERRAVVNRSDRGFKHQVKRTRFRQIGRTAVRTFSVLYMVGAKTSFALATIGHRIGKSVFMPRIVQHLLIGQNSRIKSFDVVTFVNHCFPPGGLKIVFQFNPQRTVIVYPLQTAVNIGVLKNKTAAFA